MALIVEDGTSKIDAESYLSVTQADTYHSKMGNTAWEALDDDVKEQNLRKATVYLTSTYRSAWKGSRSVLTQALDWPRIGVVTDDGNMPPGFGYGYYFNQVAHNVIPTEVKNACAELALKSVSGPLDLDLKQKVLQKTVGPITVKYDQNSSQQKQYTAIDNMLAVYLQSSGNNVKLVRC